MDAESQLGRGCSWLLWIAGCTVVNACMAATNWRLVLGLSVPDIVSALVHPANTAYTFNSVAMIAAATLGCSGAFLLLWYMAVRRSIAALVVGILLYSADAAIYGFTQDWFAVAIHVWAIFSMVGAVKACIEMNKPGYQTAAAGGTPTDARSDVKSDAADKSDL